MNISNICITTDETNNTISGMCGDFKLFYSFPKEIKITLKADAFCAASLIPAMAMGSDIIIEDNVPLSSELVDNLELLQEIFSYWGSYIGYPLKKVKIIGGKRLPSIAESELTMSFFSGGVDGTFTFLRNKDEIDKLIFAKGIDMQLSSDTLFQEAFTKNQNFLSTHEKPLLPIETNVRFLGHHYGFNWSACFGGGLSSIALAAGIKKCFIASGVTYHNMQPEGSNFITDHLWSNGHTKIVHDSADTPRLIKLKAITENPDALNILRVCWHDKSYNCGECEKCLRTMANLRVLKKSTPTFPELTDQIIKTKLSKIKLYNIHDVQFLDENIVAAEENNDVVLLKTLKKIRKNYDLRELLRNIDKLLLGDFLQKLKK